MTNVLLTVLHNKEHLNKEDETKIKEIMDRRGFGIKSLCIFYNYEPSNGLQPIQVENAVFIYPEIDKYEIGYSYGTYGEWTFVKQWKETYREEALLKGFSSGIYFLMAAIILYGFITWFSLKKRKFTFKWIVQYTPPQLIAICVFIFIYIRIY